MTVTIDGLQLVEPLIPTLPEIEGITRDDHVAFVVRPENEAKFGQFWHERGLTRLNTLRTEEYPARHTGFQRSDKATMVALSVSDDPNSPTNRLIAHLGEISAQESGAPFLGLVQHVAYTVDPSFGIEAARKVLTGMGLVPITPVHMLHTPRGTIRQALFVYERHPTGQFIELVERSEHLPIANADGQQVGFAAKQIDRLYKDLTRYYNQLGI